MARQLTSNGYIDLGNATADALLNGVTSGMAAIWVYFDNTSTEQEIWDARISGSLEFELTEFYDNPARNLRFSAVGTLAQAIIVAANLSGAAWHSLMWGWNDAVGTNGTIYLFVDGASAGTATGYGTIGSGSYVSYQLGAVLGGANMQGRIAHYGLWTGVAPDVDLAAAFHAGFLPIQIRPDKLRQYVPLWGDGASEPDLAGGYTATPTGTTSKADGPKVYPPRGVRVGRPASLVNSSVSPGKGSLVITGYAPGYLANSNVEPGAGALVIQGFSPTVEIPSRAEPGAGALVITGYAPSTLVQVSPALGTLVIQGYAPSVVQATRVEPGLGSLVITGFAPTTADTGSAVSPGKGSLVIRGYAPALRGIPRDPELIPSMTNLELVRQRANSILEYAQLMLPTYGSALPAVDANLNGRIFVLTTTQTVYQQQNGGWVAVDMVP